MAVIDRYRPGDSEAVLALYRRALGADALEALQLRWRWEHRRNPSVPKGAPPIWVAREGLGIVGHCGVVPVRLRVLDQEVEAAWLSDLVVASDRRRQRVAERLCGTWDRAVDAALGLGLPEPAYQVVRKLAWPVVGPVPCLVKPLTQRAFRQARWPASVNRVVSAITLPVVKSAGRARPVTHEVTPVRRFDERFSDLWDDLGDRFDFAVRRDEPYLNWRFRAAPHVRYSVGALFRDDRAGGYAVVRHVQQARTRVTLLVDFLAAPDDKVGLSALLGWVDRQAHDAKSDKIRCYCQHAGFRRILKQNGYFQSRSRLELVARVNVPSVGRSYYRRTNRWHVTIGDSDVDR